MTARLYAGADPAVNRIARRSGARAAATENEAAERETEPERADRKSADRERLAPEREPLPVAECGLLLLGELLPPALLAQGTPGLKAEVDVVEDLRRLVVVIFFFFFFWGGGGGGNFLFLLGRLLGQA